MVVVYAESGRSVSRCASSGRGFNAGVSVPEVARRLRVSRRPRCAAGGGAGGPGGGGAGLQRAGAARDASLTGGGCGGWQTRGGGPAAHGVGDDQRWTLARVADLIARIFRVRYTLRGTGNLLYRLGWTVQIPARRATERDEHAITAWRQETWPAVKPSRRTRGVDRLRRRGRSDAPPTKGTNLGPAGADTGGQGDRQGNRPRVDGWAGLATGPAGGPGSSTAPRAPRPQRRPTQLQRGATTSACSTPPTSSRRPARLGLGQPERTHQRPDAGN